MPVVLAFLGTLFLPLVGFLFTMKIMNIAFKILVFDIIYILSTNALNDYVLVFFAKITALNIPCGAAWVLSDLGLVTALSIYINMLISAVSLKMIIALAIRIPR